MSYSQISDCRACHGPISPVLNLGTQYVIDFPKPEEPNGLSAPLELVRCTRCGLVQLKHTVNQDRLFKHFWYQSGLSRSMEKDLHNIAQEAIKHLDKKITAHDVIVDIGSNDGTLLHQYPMIVSKSLRERPLMIGFEPALNIAPQGSPNSIVVPDYFSAESYLEQTDHQAKIITAIAMFYDLPDPNAFVRDVKEILADNGIFIIQQNYLPEMLKTVGFDNIVHEHLEYYHLKPLERLLDRHDLEIFDAEINAVNGGSLRTYVGHKGYRFERFRVRDIRTQELTDSLDSPEPFERFARNVEKVRTGLGTILGTLKSQSEKIYVMGAGTRGNTILQYAGIDRNAVEGAVDRNKAKWGRETVGGRIPIMERALAHPDYFLVLPVHFLPEFMEQEREWLAKGGRFITPLPEPRIL